jgi:glycosyltransferase involved in cell wall biosynthesis
VPAPNEPLRVAIDARYWRSAIQTGVERYILLLLEALRAASEPVEAGVVVRATEVDAFAAQGLSDVQLLPVADKRTTSLNSTLRGFGPSIVHFPFEMPARLDFPSVYTLHDPGRYLYPDLMVRKVREVQNDRLRRQLRDPNLRAVITVSQASRADIVSVLGELPCPLVVVPNFVSRVLQAVPRGRRSARCGPSRAAPRTTAQGSSARVAPTTMIVVVEAAFRDQLDALAFLWRRLRPIRLRPRLARHRLDPRWHCRRPHPAVSGKSVSDLGSTENSHTGN